MGLTHYVMKETVEWTNPEPGKVICWRVREVICDLESSNPATDSYTHDKDKVTCGNCQMRVCLL